MKTALTVRKSLFGLTSIVAGVVAAAALAAGGAGVSHGEHHEDIEGSYLVNITVANPPLGTFPDLMTFTDGTIISTRPQYITSSPAGPVLESPGHGAYNRAGHDAFNVALVNLLQGAPGNEQLQGAFFGVESINWTATVNEHDGTVSGPWTSVVKDPNGKVLFALSGTISGTRIVAP